MTFTVRAQLDGRFWFVEVPALDRVTQARNISEITVMAADLIEIVTGEHNPELDVQIQLPDDLRAHIEAADNHRLIEAQSRRAAAVELRTAAAGLRARGLTLTDVGTLLGVSHQRAHQLLSDHPSEETASLPRRAVAASHARATPRMFVEPPR